VGLKLQNFPDIHKPGFGKIILWYLAQNKDPYRKATYVGSFEVSVLAHVALRMLAAIFLASQ
jgi:hypothetical protein